MTGSQRLIAIVIAAAMLISGFAFGRMAETPKTTAEESKTALNSSPNSNGPQSASPASNEAAPSSQAFYLTDFKTGYNDGYNAGLKGENSGALNTNRAGYNEGFKDGYADGYKQANQQPLNESASAQPTGTTRLARHPVAYRSSGRRGGSKLKTALTIAAPAALGAGIGAAAGGGRGAAAGALIGGGGGALYHLLKNRN
jgi:hypothetical protein